MRRTRLQNAEPITTEDPPALNAGPKHCARSDCQRPRGEAIGWVMCSTCHLWNHTLCAGITLEEAESRPSFTCNKCDNSQMEDRAHCSTCGNQIRLTVRKLFFTHGPRDNRCAASGQPPCGLPQSDASENDSRSLMKLLQQWRCKVIKYVPKASCVAFAEAQNKLMRDVINNPNDLRKWTRMLLFPLAALKAPERAGKRNKGSLGSLINKQITRYMETDEIPSRGKTKTTSRADQKEHDSDLGKRISEKIDDGDIKGAVRIASSDDTLAQPTEDNVKELKTKHPSKPADRRPFPDAPPTAPLQVTADFVREMVSDFPNGSGGGPTGLRPQHLKNAISSSASEAGNQLCNTLADFCNLLLRGNVPAQIQPVLAGASLLSLGKKCGGIRPIAVGETLRRLTAKCAARSTTAKFAAMLAPLQLGAGVRYGAEAAAHAARLFLGKMEEDTVFMKIDFMNAFNSVRRDCIAEIFATEVPELYPFIRMCYEEASLLSYGDFIIESEEGFQQGDPIASLGFCLVLHSCLQTLKSKFKCGYLDDVSKGDHWKTVMDDLRQLKIDGAKIGLTMKPSKCELTIKSSLNFDKIANEFKKECPEIKIIDIDDATLLGAALGQRSLAELMREKLESIKLLCERVKDVPSHQAFFLIRNCFAVPKLLYLFRTSPTFNQADILTELDSLLRSTMESNMNTLLGDRSWKQLTMPVKLGGFGIPSPSQLSSPAYIASVLSTTHLVSAICNQVVELENAIALWSEKAPNATAPTWKTKQRSWVMPIGQACIDELTESAPSDRDKARLLGCQCRGSGDWINALPSNALGLCLTDDQFRISCGLRLGAPVSSAQLCLCGTQLDTHGNHQLVCPRLCSRLARHSMCNNVIKETFRSAKIPASLEPLGLLRHDGRRPDGVSLIPVERGRAIAWDFTCVNRLAASHVILGTQDGPTVANKAEERKNEHYKDMPANIIFEPVAVETLGGIGDSSWRFLKKLAGRVEEETRDRKSFAYLRQRISMALQRGNASCVAEPLF